MIPSTLCRHGTKTPRTVPSLWTVCTFGRSIFIETSLVSSGGGDGGTGSLCPVMLLVHNHVNNLGNDFMVCIYVLPAYLLSPKMLTRESNPNSSNFDSLRVSDESISGSV